MFKKTTTVVTIKEVHEGNKTTRTTETVTTSDGDAPDAQELEAAFKESHAAMDKLFDGFGERLDAVFAPFRKVGKK